MAQIEIPDKCVFEAGADQVRLTTKTNGDAIHITHLQLGKDAAAALAYLINNTDNHLKIVIKEA